MKISFILFLCLLTIGLQMEGTCQDYQETFDTLLADQLSVQSPGGTAIVAKEGKVIYKKAFGKADLELNAFMTLDHIFRIGSISKQFTASAILKLAEEGKLSLQDTITKFIQDYPTHGYTITIEHLLTHTSGIKNYTSMTKWTSEVRRKDVSPQELIDFFKDEPMDFPPGTAFRYSNSGYILLGYIIEIISGKPYAAFIHENFFVPLEMKNSFYDNATSLVPNRSSGYKAKDGQFENSDFVSMTLPYAAGSLLSTVEDLFTWHEAVMNNKVLRKASLQKAHTSYKLNNGRETGYGYGWELGNVQGSPAIKHVGRINGFVTYCVYLPQEKIFVAIFSNCECTDNLETPASKIAAIVLGHPYQWNEVKLSEEELETYQGVYKSEYEGERTIAFEDGKLMYFSKGGSKHPLTPFEKNKFHLERSLTILEFERDSKGNIGSFNLKTTGVNSTWQRTSQKIKTVNRIKVAPQALEKYLGKYQFAPDFIFYVVKEGNKLYGQVGKDKKEIVPFDKHKFFAKEIDAKLTFNVDKNGKVISLIKTQSDETMATKID